MIGRVRAFWSEFRAAFLASFAEHFAAARFGITVKEIRAIRAAETEALGRIAAARRQAFDLRQRRAVLHEIARRAAALRDPRQSRMVH